MLLLDQGLPRSLAKLLQDAGIDAEHVGDLGMSAAKDAEILEYSKNNERIIITLDSDFHTLLALGLEHNPSVVRIRIEGLKAIDYLPIIKTVFEQCEEDLKQGCVISVQESQIRVRCLPIGDK